MQTSQNGKLAFTVTWRARDGEADACANIIALPSGGAQGTGRRAGNGEPECDRSGEVSVLRGVQRRSRVRGAPADAALQADDPGGGAPAARATRKSAVRAFVIAPPPNPLPQAEGGIPLLAQSRHERRRIAAVQTDRGRKSLPYGESQNPKASANATWVGSH